jgi:TPR repeat protein
MSSSDVKEPFMTLWVRTSLCLPCAAIFISSLLATSPGDPAGHEAFLRKDYAAAYRIWKPLADHGDADAQFNLAILYERGLGVRRDPSEAFTLCHLAAAQGLTPAQVELGRMYARGWGTAQRYGEAVQWFEKAAQQGDRDAERNLGWLYDQGYGVARDYTIAAKWYRLAADQGDAEGQFALAKLYIDGNGVRKDPVQAYCLLTRASASNQKAAEQIVVLNRKLSAEQVAEGLKCAKSAAH